MPGLKESMYCSQQIHIPPMYPHLLRQFAKAAIRTQPYDLLRWSCAYFRALSNGHEPPVKYRLEYPEPKNYMGLTPGLIKVLLKQFGKSETIEFETLLDYWHGICLQDTDLLKILVLGSFQNPDEIPFYNFIAVAVGHLNENLTQTMIMLCELLTEEPEGGSAMIPVSVFLNLYRFLAKIDASNPKTVINNIFFIPPRSEIMEKSNQNVNFSQSTQFEQTKMNFTQSVDILKHPTFDPLQKASSMPAEFKKLSDVLECTDETCLNLNRSEYSITGESGALKINRGMTKITGLSDEETPLESSENLITEEHLDEDQSNIEDMDTENMEEVEAIFDVTESDDVDRYESVIVGVPEVNLPSLDSTLKSSIPSATLKPESAIVYDEELTLETQPTKSVKYPTEAVTFVDDSDDITQSAVSESTAVIKYKPGGVFPPGFEYIEYHIDIVKGIGPIVEDPIMNKFSCYITERAHEQQGMIMPRNVRHFLCPLMENMREDSVESEEILAKDVPVVAAVESDKTEVATIEDFDDDDDYGPPPCATCTCDCICKEDE